MSGIKLRDYQRDAVDAVLSEWDEGRRKTLLVMATGTGKTICFAGIIREMAARGKRSLVLAHRGELIDQAVAKISSATGLRCAVEKAELTSIDEMAMVTVGSVQTMMNESRLSAFDPDEFGCIIVDEAHHALADSYQKVLGHFPEACVLGVTATPDRGDRKDLGKYFDSIAFEYDMAHAIKDGWLCPISARMVPLDIDISSVSVQNGDYASGQLGDALEPYLDAIADDMAETCRGRRTVVFLPLIKTSVSLKDKLIERGVIASEVNGQSQDRAEKLKAFDEGKIDVLCNSMLLTEGWDCPSVDCIVVLRPTRSRALYCQMVGRGTRLSPDTGKTELVLLDYLWNTGRHQLCRPAALLARTDEVSAAMTKVITDAGGDIDLMDAEQQAQKDVQEERERALAKRLEEVRHRKAKLVDPLQYEVSICDNELRDYVPTFAWQRDSASDGQKKMLAFFGVDGTDMDKGKASLLIDKLQERKDKGFATPKQVRLLERRGFRHPGTWTKNQASKVIGMLSANNWRMPPHINPATYRPEEEKANA